MPRPDKPPKSNGLWWQGFFNGYDGHRATSTDPEYLRGWWRGKSDARSDREWADRHGSSNA